MILLLTAEKNKSSFDTRFEHIYHSSWIVCDRSRFVMYHEISSLRLKNCMIYFTKKYNFTTEYINYILLLSVLQIYFVDIHVCL